MGVRSGATAAGAGAVVGALVAVSVAAAPADVGAPAALVGGATDDAVGSVDDVSASNESAEPELRPARLVDLLARLREPRPLTDGVQRPREVDRDRALPPVRLSLCHVEQRLGVEERGADERDRPDDEDLSRGHRPAAQLAAPRPAGWSVSRILGCDGGPSVGRVRVGVAMPATLRDARMAGRVISDQTRSELEVDERGHADGAEGVDQKKQPARVTPCATTGNVRELRPARDASSLGTNWLASMASDREDEQRRDERRRLAPRA